MTELEFARAERLKHHRNHETLMCREIARYEALARFRGLDAHEQAALDLCWTHLAETWDAISRLSAR